METDYVEDYSAIGIVDSLIYTFDDVEDNPMNGNNIDDKYEEKSAALGQDLIDVIACNDGSGLPQRRRKERRRDRKKNQNDEQKLILTNRPKREQKYEYLDHTAGIIHS